MSNDEQSSSRRPATPSPDDKPQSLRALAEMARRQKTERASAPPSLRTPLPVVASAPPPEASDASEGEDADTGVFMPPTQPPATAPKERRSILIGALIAMMGIGGAAAYALQTRADSEERSNTAAATQDASTSETRAEADVDARRAESANAAAVPSPSGDDGIDLDALPDSDDVDPAVDPKAPVAAAGATEAEPPPTQEPKAPDVAKKAPDPSGTLAETIADAVGGDPSAPAPDEADSAAAPSSTSANIPKHPPQGAVQAGVRPARSAAKACVTGADAPSQANLTFGSSGTVQSVSVSGWAAANGKSACVQSAFAGASVGPFQDPSYTVGVVIRP